MSRHKKSTPEKPVVDDVCRLCLTKDDLVWIFDERIAEPNNMKDVIFLTTGVEIKSTDMVSQKVCKKCCQITIKIFKFRNTAIKNDRELKNKLSQITNNCEDDETIQDCSTSDKGNQASVCRVVPTPVAPQGTKNPNKAAGAASSVKSSQANRRDTSPPATKKRSKLSIEESSNCSVKSSPIKKQDMLHSQAHESIIKLSDEYTGLKIPRSCVMCDLNPSVVLDSDKVRKWFQAKLEIDLKRRKEAKKREFEAEKFSVIKKSSKYKRNLIESDEDDSDAIIVVDEPPPETSRKTKTPFAPITAKRRLISVESLPPKRKASVDAASVSSHDQDADEVCSNSSVSERGSVFSGGDLFSSINKSTNVHVCQICNAVTYNNKEMKNHVRKHTMCPFCKVRFRTLEAKTTHVEKECPIRSIMQNLPKIPLVKIDQVKDVTDKYPSAFPADQDSSCDTVSESDTIIVERTTPVEFEQNKPVAEIDITFDDDVMYISDDDDDDPVVLSVPKPPEEISKSRSEITKPEETVIRPKIPKFDMPDNEILKNVDWKGMEGNVLKSLIRLVDKYQTFSRPTNASNITVQGQNDKIYALKNIVPYLRRYKIPIELEYSSKLTVQYEDDTPPRVKVKDLWDPQGAAIQRSILPKSLITELNKTPRGLQTKPSTKKQPAAQIKVQPTAAQNKVQPTAAQIKVQPTTAQIKVQPAAAQNKVQPAATHYKQLTAPSTSNSNTRLSLKPNQTITVSAPSKQVGSSDNAPQQINVQEASSSSTRLSSKPNEIIASVTVAAPSNEVSSSLNTFPLQSVVQEASSSNTVLSSSSNQTVSSVIVPATSNYIGSSVNAYPRQVSPSINTFPLQSVLQESSSSNTMLSSSPNQTVSSVIVPSSSNYIDSSVDAYPRQVSVPEAPIAQVNNVVSLHAAPMTQMNLLPTPQINMPLTQAPAVSHLSSVVPVQAPIMSSIPATPVSATSSSLRQVSQDLVMNGETIFNSILSQMLDVPVSNAGDDYVTDTNSNTARPRYQYDYVSSASSAVFTNDVPSMARSVILNNENINKQSIRVKTISELNRKE